MLGPTPRFGGSRGTQWPGATLSRVGKSRATVAMKVGERLKGVERRIFVAQTSMRDGTVIRRAGVHIHVAGIYPEPSKRRLARPMFRAAAC